MHAPLEAALGTLVSATRRLRVPHAMFPVRGVPQSHARVTRDWNRNVFGVHERVNSRGIASRMRMEASLNAHTSHPSLPTPHPAVRCSQRAMHCSCSAECAHVAHERDVREQEHRRRGITSTAFVTLFGVCSRQCSMETVRVTVIGARERNDALTCSAVCHSVRAAGARRTARDRRRGLPCVHCPGDAA